MSLGNIRKEEVGKTLKTGLMPFHNVCLFSFYSKQGKGSPRFCNACSQILLKVSTMEWHLLIGIQPEKSLSVFNRRNIVKGIDYLGDGGAKTAIECGEQGQRWVKVGSCHHLSIEETKWEGELLECIGGCLPGGSWKHDWPARSWSHEKTYCCQIC